MASELCDGCGRDVRIGGGVENVWTLEGGQTEGMTLELSDGDERFVCFECIERLPEDPTKEDVEALPDREGPIEFEDDDGGIRYVGLGLALGAVLGIALGWHFEDTSFWFTFGVGIGFASGLILGRIVELREES